MLKLSVLLFVVVLVIIVVVTVGLEEVVLVYGSLILVLEVAIELTASCH